MSQKPVLSVLIPAHDEAGWIPRCLDAVAHSQGDLSAREIIVIANACRDRTADQALAMRPALDVAGWTLNVIRTDTPGKLNALNLGDSVALGDIRVYLDADVLVGPSLVAELAGVLTTDLPRYATGSPRIARAASRISRAYARFWERLPFVRSGAPGFGLFAVNAAGRARWQEWPDIIADDMFARLNFTPDERMRVSARYDWPPVEGFGNLIRVRRRQNAGNAELARAYPELMRNEDTTGPGMGELARLALNDPLGFGVYAGVRLGVRSPLFSSAHRWARGR